MHRYASQTPEARELVAELEFVWDQIKSNSSSSVSASVSSSPLRAVGVPPLAQQTYASIGGRMAGEDDGGGGGRNYEKYGRGDSRLRVLSPVSQPEEYRRGELDDEEDEDEDEDEEEEFAEAHDDLYDEDDTSTRQEKSMSEVEDPDDQSIQRSTRRTSRSGSAGGTHHDTRKWRRRVEQALTKMTAEIAAMREQMETRALARRRRSGLWAWLKWLVWVALRQIVWDLAMLGMLLIYMRLRGDRRVEDRLKAGWVEVKARVYKLRSLRRLPRTPLLP